MLVLLHADGDLWLKVFSVTMDVKLAQVLTLNVITELLECCNCIIWFLFRAVSSRETAQLHILVLYQLIWNFQYVLHNLIENIATSHDSSELEMCSFARVWGDEGNPLCYTVLSLAGSITDRDV